MWVIYWIGFIVLMGIQWYINVDDNDEITIGDVGRSLLVSSVWFIIVIFGAGIGIWILYETYGDVVIWGRQ